MPRDAAADNAVVGAGERPDAAIGKSGCGASGSRIMAVKQPRRPSGATAARIGGAAGFDSDRGGAALSGDPAHPPARGDPRSAPTERHALGGQPLTQGRGGVGERPPRGADQPAVADEPVIDPIIDIEGVGDAGGLQGG